MMSGDKESRVDESIREIHKNLDSFSEKNGLAISPESDISIYINQTDDMLRKLDADDAGNAAYMVSRHAAYIKKLYNREAAVIKWARAQLNIVAVKLCKTFVNDKYMKLEEKIAVVVSENEYAKELHKKLLAAEMRSAELYDLHDQLNRLSDKLTDIQRTRRSERFQR